MDATAAQTGYRRILVTIPNWVGDVVLATPVLAALRACFAGAQITYLMRRYVREVVEGGGWHDAEVFWPERAGWRRQLRTFDLAGRLRAGRFDLALLLTNSFRSALLARLARIRRRVGYARDGRSWLLTDRLKPLKRDGQFVPSPVLDYYAKLAEHVGCVVADRKLRLAITPQQEGAGAELARHYGLDHGRPYAVINPGAAFGAAKCWLPERFAEVCDRLRTELNLLSVIVGAPGESPLMREIARRAKTEVICCDEPGTTLGSLKILIRDAALLICNDTGPRHYGNAFDVPTVTIFGPTHQEWTDTDYAGEIKIQVPVECGPCQLPTCPLDLRCMAGVTTEMVMARIRRLLDEPRASARVDEHVPQTGAKRTPRRCQGADQMMLHSDHIRIDSAYRDALRAGDLARVESVLTRTAGRTAAWSRTTDTLYVANPGGGPGFYLKRYYYASWPKRVRGAFRGTFFGLHRGRAEFRLLSEMRALGLPGVRPVAYGSRRVGHFVTACFLITEEVPGACNLTTFARNVRTGRETLHRHERALIVRRLARQIAELHSAGFAHGQLFWRNVLIRFGPTGDPEFFFLDVRPRRGGRRLRRSSRWWLHELGHTAASALPFTTRSERTRFLVEYLGGRRLSPDIRRQIREIDRVAQRWEQHERQRIKMNDLLEEWNRQLEAESVQRPPGGGEPVAAVPGAPS